MIMRKQVTIRMVATAKKRRDTNLTQGMVSLNSGVPFSGVYINQNLLTWVAWARG